jgi:MFS family permease
MCAAWPINTWMPTFLATPLDAGGAGQTVSNSSLLMFSTYFGSLFGYIAFGFVSDRLGRKKTFLLWIILASIFTVIQVNVATISVLAYIIVGIFQGATCNAMYAGFGPILAEMFPTNIRATASGIAYNGGRGVGSFAVTGVGVLFTSFAMQKVLMLLPILFVGALICLLFLKESKGTSLES